jgi:hypothetical protein
MLSLPCLAQTLPGDYHNHHLPHHAHLGVNARDDTTALMFDFERFHPKSELPGLLRADLNVLLEGNNVRRTRKQKDGWATATLMPRWAVTGWPKFVCASALSCVIFFATWAIDLAVGVIGSLYFLLLAAVRRRQGEDANPQWHEMQQN